MYWIPAVESLEEEELLVKESIWRRTVAMPISTAKH